MTNPLQLSRSQFYHHIHMTYLRCLSCCFYCPDVWLQFAEFEFSFNRENAKKVLEKAVSAIPESILLRFGCCDFFETNEMFSDCEEYYAKCIESFTEPIVWIKYLQYTQRQKGTEACHSLFLRAIQECTDKSLFVAMGILFKTHSFTHSLFKTHSFIHSFTHSLIHSLSHYLTISLSHYLTISLSHSTNLPSKRPFETHF